MLGPLQHTSDVVELAVEGRHVVVQQHVVGAEYLPEQIDFIFLHDGVIGGQTALEKLGHPSEECVVNIGCGYVNFLLNNPALDPNIPQKCINFLITLTLPTTLRAITTPLDPERDKCKILRLKLPLQKQFSPLRRTKKNPITRILTINCLQPPLLLTLLRSISPLGKLQLAALIPIPLGLNIRNV